MFVFNHAYYHLKNWQKITVGLLYGFGKDHEKLSLPVLAEVSWDCSSYKRIMAWLL